MQLSSTLFGMCVVNVKPQLERVLNLPSEILMKEIKLTQVRKSSSNLMTKDLMELMIEYKISPETLSFTGIESSSNFEKLGEVYPILTLLICTGQR